MSTSLLAVEANPPFSASAVTRVIRTLLAPNKSETRRNWLAAVARRTVSARPDLAGALESVLGVEMGPSDVLAGLTIGEIGVCYEALLASLDRGQRRDAGQYFTPDDASQFMARHATSFPSGRWLDPCCGVGNLSWHLASVQESPAEFVREHLILLDRDETALRTAVALIAADFAAEGDHEAVEALRSRSHRRDFLSSKALPKFDFAILNPPYARAPRKAGYRTSETRDLFAYFLERIVHASQGFIAVTPASYLSIPKFRSLRDVIEEGTTGGDVYVFDNVPDTLFRGYKFGSNNTSKTNFVRAAVTVSAPQMREWRVTPILRWNTASREEMFSRCHDFLAPRRLGPHGEWAKLAPGLEAFWDSIISTPRTLADLLVEHETPFPLTVATTPRYYISATYRPLDRRSKSVLYFRSDDDRRHAAIVLNSSLPYLWWRILDGGVSLPRRVLMSVPIPELPAEAHPYAERLQESEALNVVTKLNAGRHNENVKHPQDLVDDLNSLVIPAAAGHLHVVYSQNMFEAAEAAVLAAPTL